MKLPRAWFGYTGKEHLWCTGTGQNSQAALCSDVSAMFSGHVGISQLLQNITQSAEVSW